MQIHDVLRSKGPGVITVDPDTTVTELLAVLAEHRIGAAVINGGEGIAGIVSERDIVRRLHSDGQAVLGGPVSAIMTGEVLTCARTDEVEEVARTMTEHRVRHIPVVDASGSLTDIVSIGDLVKHRIDQLQAERDQLVAYIQQ